MRYFYLSGCPGNDKPGALKDELFLATGEANGEGQNTCSSRGNPGQEEQADPGDGKRRILTENHINLGSRCKEEGGDCQGAECTAKLRESRYSQEMPNF